MATTKFQPPGGIRSVGGVPDISKYWNLNDTPYTSTAQVLSELPIGIRHTGLKVQVLTQEYWWPTIGGITDGELVVYSVGGGGGTVTGGANGLSLDGTDIILGGTVDSPVEVLMPTTYSGDDLSVVFKATQSNLPYPDTSVEYGLYHTMYGGNTYSIRAASQSVDDFNPSYPILNNNAFNATSYGISTATTQSSSDGANTWNTTSNFNYTGFTFFSQKFDGGSGIGSSINVQASNNGTLLLDAYINDGSGRHHSIEMMLSGIRLATYNALNDPALSISSYAITLESAHLELATYSSGSFLPTLVGSTNGLIYDQDSSKVLFNSGSGWVPLSTGGTNGLDMYTIPGYVGLGGYLVYDTTISGDGNDFSFTAVDVFTIGANSFQTFSTFSDDATTVNQTPTGFLITTYYSSAPQSGIEFYTNGGVKFLQGASYGTAGQVLMSDGAGGVIWDTPAGGGGGFYQTIQAGGTPVTQRDTFNFIGSISAVDNTTKTDIFLSDTLEAFSAYNSDGFIVQITADTFVAREIESGDGGIVVTDGNGVAGNPTLSLGSSVVRETAASTYTAGEKQSFVPNTTNAGINIGSYSSNPSSLADYDVWGNSSTEDIHARITSYTVSLTRTEDKVVSTTTYAFVESDRNKILRFTHASGCTATLPIGLTNNWLTTVMRDSGAGVLTIASSGTLQGAGTTLDTAVTAATIHHPGSNVHKLMGAVGSGSSGVTITSSSVTSTGTLTTTANKIYNVFVDATAGNVVITLPAGDATTVHNIKRIDSTANTVTFTGTIDGDSAYLGTVGLLPYEGFQLIYNGTAFYAL